MSATLSGEDVRTDSWCTDPVERNHCGIAVVVDRSDARPFSGARGRNARHALRGDNGKQEIPCATWYRKGDTIGITLIC